jgi:ATP-dependent protease Clp ATPase subunit
MFDKSNILMFGPTGSGKTVCLLTKVTCKQHIIMWKKLRMPLQVRAANLREFWAFKTTSLDSNVA